MSPGIGSTIRAIWGLRPGCRRVLGAGQLGAGLLLEAVLPEERDKDHRLDLAARVRRSVAPDQGQPLLFAAPHGHHKPSAILRELPEQRLGDLMDLPRSR